MCQLDPSHTIVSEVYWAAIAFVVVPSIVSDALPSIVTALLLESVFLIVNCFPEFPLAAYRVIVKAPPEALQRITSSDVVAV
jgi:hypothetical protein